MNARMQRFKATPEDIRAAAMMIECGCDKAWVARYIGLSREQLNRRLMHLKMDRRLRAYLSRD